VSGFQGGALQVPLQASSGTLCDAYQGEARQACSQHSASQAACQLAWQGTQQPPHTSSLLSGSGLPHAIKERDVHGGKACADRQSGRPISCPASGQGRGPAIGQSVTLEDPHPLHPLACRGPGSLLRASRSCACPQVCPASRPGCTPAPQGVPHAHPA
jgi:hypothetical protein